MFASARLAVGTLTAIPVRGPDRVTPPMATGAMMLAPLAVFPLGLAVAAVTWAGGALDAPRLAVAIIALATLALGTRVLHLDGLADVVDGLTASYDRERSLTVMKGSTAGPAGVVALVLVLGLQATALAASLGGLREAVIAGCAVCCSRSALWLTCARSVPPARPDGLGVTFTQRIPVAFAVLGWSAWAGAAVVVDPVRGPITIVVTVVVVLALVRRTVTRLGGVTGDVFGAAIEVALALLLLGWAVS